MPVSPSGFAVCLKTFISPSLPPPPNLKERKKDNVFVHFKANNADGPMDNTPGTTIATLRSSFEF